MRIRVHSTENRLWVLVTVASQITNRSTPVKFVLDTGSTHTFISQSSALDLGLESQLPTLRKDNRDVFMGGGVHSARILPQVMFLFEAEGGGVFPLEMPEVRVVEPKNDRTRRQGSLPNILGFDVLNEGKLTTVIQPWRNYFTITDEPVSIGGTILA